MRAYLYEGWPSQRAKKQSLLAVLRGPVAFFYCILLAHVFAVFGVSVPAGAWIVIYAGLCIYPYLTVRGGAVVVLALGTLAVEAVGVELWVGVPAGAAATDLDFL